MQHDTVYKFVKHRQGWIEGKIHQISIPVDPEQEKNLYATQSESEGSPLRASNGTIQNLGSTPKSLIITDIM